MVVSQFVTFSESIYKFTHPIRLFKANDPYFYQVDNIPLEQLRDNTLWIRDQLSNLTVQIDGIGRESFNELRPYVIGTDEKVRVLPGRYTSRINDVHRKDALIRLLKTSGNALGELDAYKIDGLLVDLESALQDVVSTASLNFNGLAERCSLFAALSEDTAAPNATGTYGGFLFTNRIPFPILEDFLNSINLSVDQVPLVPSNANYFHNKFVQMWRGVARTAIVDVPEELEISIPKFDANDFFVTETNGIKTLLPATQRIDLVFIYSHPIDSSGTWINKDGTPQQITRPALGIVKGAGVGLQITNTSSLVVQGNPTTNVDADGNTQILPSVADEANNANGFSGLDIHGSFPSPDDLMNIAPLLVEGLSFTDYQLIGQTIMPVAYVLVRDNATQTIGGQGIILGTDVVDIRPFFRTTELTYNERAGLAAAVPALSLANPAVGQVQMDGQLNELKNFVDTGLATLAGGVPTVLAGGLIRGGLKYGVEGAILRTAGLITYTGGDLDGNPQFAMNQILDGSLLGDTTIPLDPEWDLADWAVVANPIGGSFRNDWLNIRNTIGGIGAGNVEQIAQGNNEGNGSRFLFMKKKINIINAPSYMLAENGGTYDVTVQFENCVPASIIGQDDDTNAKSSPMGVWVERHRDYFVIYVGMPQGIDHAFQIEDDRDKIRYYQMCTTIDHDAFRPDSDSQNDLAVAIYATVSWKLIAYPQGFYRDGTTGTLDLLGT